MVVGHDWGAPVAWYAALMRPDVFRAVAALSVPYIPPIGGLPEGMTINDVMRAEAAGRDYYRLYFQEPGVAEADLEADVERSVLGLHVHDLRRHRRRRRARDRLGRPLPDG